MPEGSSVILTTSCSGSKGEAGLSVYAAAKAALRSLARSLSAELMPTKGIRVNTVSPGMTATRIHAETDKESVSAYMYRMDDLLRQKKLQIQLSSWLVMNQRICLERSWQ